MKKEVNDIATIRKQKEEKFREECWRVDETYSYSKGEEWQLNIDNWKKRQKSLTKEGKGERMDKDYLHKQ